MALGYFRENQRNSAFAAPRPNGDLPAALAYIFQPCHEPGPRYHSTADEPIVNSLTTQPSALTVSMRTIPRSTARWQIANGVALLAVAVLLRIWRLENMPGINGDEAWSGVQAWRLLHGESIDWTTPSGNPMNLFYFLPLVALQAFFPPSFVLLRTVSLASGLAALVANYFLCRRAFDTRTAVISTLVLALLPIDIAYSRFAWDTSQSLLATVLVMYLPLMDRGGRARSASWSVIAMVALAAAILVHPTNVFAVPLLVVPTLYERRRDIVARLKDTAIPAQTWALMALVGASAAVVYCAWHGLVDVVARLHGLGELGLFAANYLRLFSGTTVYEYISGASVDVAGVAWAGSLMVACDWLFGCLAMAALYGMARRWQARPTDADASLVIGWFAMLLGFFAVAGPGAIAPHYERYGICLIAPGVLVMSRGLGWWIDERQRHRRAAATVLALAAWLWPLGFYCGYFAFVEHTGGRSHVTFRTAAVEPKLAAFRFILAHRTPDEPVTVVCHEWWNYWPLAYLAGGNAEVRVLTWAEWQAMAARTRAARVGSTWFVEFAGTVAEDEARRERRRSGAKDTETTICDYAGRVLLAVIGPAENSFENY